MTNEDFNDEAQGSTSLLGLARKIHDEHVAEGRAIADKLIADAKVKAENIVASAHSDTQERAEKVEQLIAVESEYRTRLREIATQALSLLNEDEFEARAEEENKTQLVSDAKLQAWAEEGGALASESGSSDESSSRTI